MRRFDRISRVMGGLCALAVLAAGLAFAQAPDSAGAEEGKPVTFATTARIEVDATGKLVKVEASNDLPAHMRTYVEQQLATWTFARKGHDDLAGNATSYVTLGACALPQADGTFAMGLAFGGYGPRLSTGTMMRPTGDLAAAIAQSRVVGHIDVAFVVNADGSAKVDAIEGIGDPRIRKIVSPAIKRWIAAQRFDPESVGGQPVATRVRVGLDIAQYSNRRSGDESPPATTSPACQRAGMAVAPAMDMVSTDSVVSIKPAI